jgi:hypothetical protein
MKSILFFILLGFLIRMPLPVFAEDNPDHDSMPGMNHEDQQMTHTELFQMEQGSGTAMNPKSVPMTMKDWRKDGWNLMFHGTIFAAEMQQSGPRGDDQFFGVSHFMLMGQHMVRAKDSFELRTMLSLDPATVPGGFYPLLFQTGETFDGRAIVDGQHPHDFFMEVAAQYTLALRENTMLNFYFGVRGDPALGPVAYPHRVSAMQLPQATLSHHLQDSTHIADDVLTLGIKHKMFLIEGSAFHGAEPDDHRWDFDQGALDSWSSRLTLRPATNWTAQVSTGHLHRPEELEAGDVQRTTASVTYYRPLDEGSFAASWIWGHNNKFEEDRHLNSNLFEALYRFKHWNWITGRIEVVDKDELFLDDPNVPPNIAEQIFTIDSFTFGYARDFPLIRGWETGIGGNFSLFSFSQDLGPYYGNHPVGFLIYFKFKQNSMEHH